MLRSMRTVLFAGVMLLLLACACVVQAAQPTTLGPRLYITFHGGKNGVNSIYSYDLNGNLISNNFAQGDGSAKGLRSMLLQSDGTMLVSNANKDDSRIVQYSACAADGSRSYVRDFTDSHVAHAYGLASGLNYARGDEVVWASNQDTFDISQFTAGTGVFQEQVKSFGTEEIRSLAYNPKSGILYVANEDENAVLAYDTKTDSWVASAGFSGIATPVGLFFDQTRDLLYIGSNGSPGAAYAYDVSVTPGVLRQTFQSPGLSHPAGLLAIDDRVLVLSQDAGTLLEFSYSTGQLVRTLIGSFDDTVEQIMLSPC